MNSRTVEGARLRRHVLRGAVIVFITAGARGSASRMPCYAARRRAGASTPATASRHQHPANVQQVRCPSPAAGYSSKRFIFERAKELGVRSVVIDGPDSWSKVGGPSAVCTGRCHGLRRASIAGQKAGQNARMQGPSPASCSAVAASPRAAQVDCCVMVKGPHAVLSNACLPAPVGGCSTCWRRG